MSDIISANVNDLLDRAEDPEKMVKLLVVEMEEHVEQARAGLAKAIAGEKQLETNLKKNRDAADEWYAKAKGAMERGDEDLARRCLERKKEFERIADSVMPQWEVARKTSDALKSDFRRLEEKLEEARRKRDVLVARKLAAEAQKEVASVAPAMSKAQRSYAKFDRMEGKIEQMEAEAKAILELSDEQRSLDREVVDRERAAEVDAELAALKMETRKPQ
ncbi:MAG: PspA/IM30 family protein [Pirellulaceae bacterium]|jgi:phage shock protein A|nr:PspA/IM30 family protein [Pirellulaceae bacterium]